MVNDTDDFYGSIGGFSNPAEGSQQQTQPNNPSGDGLDGNGTPPPTPPATPPPPAGQLPSTKEFFGQDFEIEDWEKVKSEIPVALKAAKEYESRKSELEQLRSLNSNPFANEQIAELNEFVKKTGITDVGTFQHIKGLDLASADAIEIMVANEILESPQLIGKENVVRAKLIKQHGLDDSENTPDEIEVNKIALEKNVNALREKLKGFQSLKYTPQTPESVESAITQKAEGYKSLILGSVADITAIPVEAEDGEGKMVKVLDYAIPAEYIQKSANNMAILMARQGLDVTEKTLPNIREAVINNAIVSNFKKIVHAAVKQREKEISEQYDIKLDNPSAFGSQGNQGTPSGARRGSFEDQLFSDN